MIRNNDKSVETLPGYKTANAALEKMFSEKTQNPRIAESAFVNRYLPLLHGDLEINEDEYPIYLWMEVALTPFNEVDVVDDTTGDVLFTVPPLGQTYDPDKRDSSMFEVMTEALKRENSMPMMGLNYLRSVQSADFKRSGEPLVFYERMSEIFKRYGLKPLVAESDSSTSDDDSQTDNGIDAGVEI